MSESEQCAVPGCFCTRDPEELKTRVIEVSVEPPANPCKDCGKPDGSFACKIRHVSVNVENLRRDH